jgi:hypothetical protein
MPRSSRRSARRSPPRRPRTSATPDHLGTTFHGFMGWEEHELKHFGYMLLAKEEGHKEKVAAYKDAVYRLVRDLQHATTQYADPDRRRDLEVLLAKALVLWRYTQKVL